MKKSNILKILFVIGLLTVVVRSAQAKVINLITFEDPSLGTDARQVIDPYVDPKYGVTFSEESGNGVVGLVKNSATSACVEPADSDQKLGTVTQGSDSIGLSGFPIRASFDALLPGPVTVTAEFQTGLGVPIRIRLFDDNGIEVGSVLDTADPDGGTCGFPGDPRARKTISVTTNQPVAYAIMDLEDETGSRVFVIDNFTFETGNTLDTILECSGPGTAGDLANLRGVRFTADQSFSAIEMNFAASSPGQFDFDAELRRSSGYTGGADYTTTVNTSLPDTDDGVPYKTVRFDFGTVPVSGTETFTLKFVENSAPSSWFFEIFGIGNTPCPDVEETNENDVANPTERSDPAGFRVLTGETPPPLDTLLECAGPGSGGDLANLRGVRFTVDQSFSAIEMNFAAGEAGHFDFDAELRRSSGYLGAADYTTNVSTLLPDTDDGVPYKKVRFEFGPVPVSGTETFTLKFVENSAPSSWFFEIFGIGNTPCPDVEETNENDVANPTERSDPAGFRVLTGETPPPLDTLLECVGPGSGGDLANLRGVRFTVDQSFSAIEMNFAAEEAGHFDFDAELRRSSGYLGAADYTTNVSTLLPDSDDGVPYKKVRFEFGPVPVSGTETFTLKFVENSAPSSWFFEIFGIGNTPCPGVEETNENDVANPTERSDPAGFKVLLDPSILPPATTGSITVMPVASDNTVTFDFTLGTEMFSLASGESQTVDALEAGSYTIMETVPAGWKLTEISCDDRPVVSEPEMAEMMIELAAGESVTCTFTHEKEMIIIGPAYKIYIPLFLFR